MPTIPIGLCRWDQLRDAKELLKSRQKSAGKRPGSRQPDFPRNPASTADKLEFCLQNKMPMESSWSLQYARSSTNRHLHPDFNALTSPTAESATFGAFDLGPERLAGDAVELAEPQDEQHAGSSVSEKQEANEEKGQQQAGAVFSEDPAKIASGDEEAKPVCNTALKHWHQIIPLAKLFHPLKEQHCLQKPI